MRIGLAAIAEATARTAVGFEFYQQFLYKNMFSHKEFHVPYSKQIIEMQFRKHR